MTQIRYDQKWQKLLRRSRWFRYLPFVDFVLVAGSMALGDVHDQSDFDVIVGTRSDRLYTARFFCLASYTIMGWRRSARRISDGFCFNHFITREAYCLNPPYNIYWQELYKNLAPVCGDAWQIEKFFKANESWVKISKKKSAIDYDLRFYQRGRPAPVKIFEYWLAGSLGNWLEKTVRHFQIYNIEKFLKRVPAGYKPRLIYNDKEVELHLDTRRLETIKNRRFS